MKPAHKPVLPVGLGPLTIVRSETHVTIPVQVLVDGVLERATPHGRGYRFTATAPCGVTGVLIDGRYVPQLRPCELEVGEHLDITRDEVSEAQAMVRPVDRCPKNGLQYLRAVIDRTTGSTDVLVPGQVIKVVNPEILVDGRVETVGGWMDRTYTTHMGSRRPYERDLVLRVSSGMFVMAHKCRPTGFGGAHLLIIARGFSAVA